MYKEIIQDSIDYIEDNIKCDISAEELSERAGFSVFHYYRLFQTAVGLPVMQYILRRRLLNAIYDIKCGNKMIDVALMYGFETHAGFYKAFAREFGCTPAQYLKLHRVKRPYRINIVKEYVVSRAKRDMKLVYADEKRADFLFSFTEWE